MIVLEIALVACVILGCLHWLWQAVCAFRMTRVVDVLERETPPQPRPWPKLSVIVPACNEADTIESAVESLLAQDYPDLQVLLVNDRSTDATGAAIDRLAARDPRVRAVHVTSLPDGWLGKVHAMHQALRRADGEYVLFTDADVHFMGDVLRRAMAYCVANDVDFLAGMPELWHRKLLVGSMISVSMRHLNAAMRFWAVHDARSSAYMGIGAFNLVRREAYDRTPGLEWLRMEVADDAGLGLMMKRSGARCRMVNLRGLLGLQWYNSVGGMFRGVEKAFASVARCSLLRCLVVCVVLLGLELAPYAALLPLGGGGRGGWGSAGLPGAPWLGLPVPGGGLLVWAALATIAVSLVSSWWVTRWVRHPFWPSALAPVGIVLGAVGLIRSGVIGWRRGGIDWRGTFYPSAQLVEGQRVRVVGRGRKDGCIEEAAGNKMKNARRSEAPRARRERNES